MPRMHFSDRVNNVFAEMDTDYNGVRSLMFDLCRGDEIYDDESGRVISPKEASGRLREMSRKIFGLGDNPSKRDRKRAYRDHGREFFDVIEEIEDWKITVGIQENEWFNELVRYRNLKDGDSQTFVVEADDVILSIAKMGRRHHDTILQRLNEGSTYSVATELYGAAVGADIDKFILGQVEWDKMVDAIAKSFVYMIQNMILTEIKDAYTSLSPTISAKTVSTGALSVATKDAFDEIIENVSILNGNAPVCIMGTHTALKKINNLADVNWRSSSQKEDVAAMGRLGSYETTTLIELPQRFTDKTLSQKLFPNDKLFIFAMNGNKLVDMVDVGETHIDEITEHGEAYGRVDDIMKYEVQRELGVATRLHSAFGQWTITA